MLVSDNKQFAVSNLGWVDKGQLWHYNYSTNVINIDRVSEASYLKLYSGKDPELFLVAHYYKDSRFCCTVHNFADASAVLARLSYKEQTVLFEGDLSLFSNFRQYLATHVDVGSGAQYQLVTINLSVPTLEFDTFDFFDDSYDPIYQGISDVYEHSSGTIIVTIARDSNPVLYDVTNRKVLRKFRLAENYGNPTFQKLEERKEYWTVDYDTLVKLDAQSLGVKQVQEIQPASNGVSYFVGNFTFNSDETLCYVARPYSGDVIAIDTEDMQPRFRADTGSKPLDAVLMKDDAIVARDWKTGDFLWASLEKI